MSQREGADGHHVDPDDAVLRIQPADQELFAVQSSKERSEDGRSGDRGVQRRRRRRGPVFAHQRDPVSRHGVFIASASVAVARSECPVNREWPCPPPSSSRCLAPPFTAQGWGVEEEGGMARSRGTGLKEGPRDGTRKAWPLLFSAGSHPLGVHSESDAGGHAGASWGDGGVVRLPPVCRRSREGSDAHMDRRLFDIKEVADYPASR